MDCSEVFQTATNAECFGCSCIISVADDGFDVITSGRAYNIFSTTTSTSFEQC